MDATRTFIRPVFTAIVLLAVVAAGLGACPKMGVDPLSGFPGAGRPAVTVTTVLRGAGPESIERNVSAPLEEALASLGGLETLRSTSVDSASQVVLQFSPEKDMDAAAQEVRARVQATLSRIPREAEQPVVEKRDPGADPVLTLALSGPIAPEELTRLAGDVVKPALRLQAGVGAVEVVGGRPRDSRSLAGSRSAAARDGRPAAALIVVKQAGVGTVQVAERIAGALAGIRKQLPQGAELEVVRDSARFARASIRGLRKELLLGGLLAIAVALLFLRSWRSTLAAALALPIAVAGTTAAMHALGATFDAVTVLALALSTGLLIGDAILVVESIRRHAEAGATPEEAAHAGTREIARAVLAATLATVAVFVPVAFMDGVAGRFFAAFGITVAVAVGISCLVSMTLTPMASAVMLRTQGEPGPISRAIERVLSAFERVALRSMGWALDHRTATAALAVATLVATAGAGRHLQLTLLPAQDASEVKVALALPAGFAVPASGGIAGGGSRPQPVQLGLRGQDWAQVVSAAGKVQAHMKASPLYADVDSTLRPGTPQELPAGLREESSLSQIDRQGRLRQITLLAELPKGVSLGAAMQDLSAFTQKELPGTVVAGFEGQGKELGRTGRAFLRALLLGAILLYVVLAAQLGSLVDPLTILLPLPFAAAGAIGGLLATGQSMSMFTMIGVIMLMGLATRNGILLVAFANELREQGCDTRESLVEAGRVRLRPILATTAAMVAGMVPVALAHGDGAEARAPVATAIIGGLISSAALTLVVVPVLYALLERLKRRRRAAEFPPPEPPPEPARAPEAAWRRAA